MTAEFRVECPVHFKRRGRGARRELHEGEEPAAASPPPGRVPRVARLMALALHFDRLLAAGEVRTYSELADLGHVTRARISQIMNLVNLAPDLQEALLHLPTIPRGRDPLKLALLQPICSTLEWRTQRKAWTSLPLPGAGAGSP